jgi:hypothetical protein
MGDGLDVSGRYSQKPVRQVRQGAGDCEFLADLRYVLVSRVAARCSMTGQIGAAADRQARFGFCAAIALRNRQHDRPVSYRVHAGSPPFPRTLVPLAQASPAVTTSGVRAFAWLLAINTSRKIAPASAACPRDSVTMLTMRATGTNAVKAGALLTA